MPTLKWLLLAVPAAALLGAAATLNAGESEVARVLLAGGIGLCIWLGGPFLPVYTLSRGPVFRWVKWVTLISALVLAFEGDALRWSWLLFSCLSPLVWTEWTRVSIRRKLPVAKWPKQLYL